MGTASLRRSTIANANASQLPLPRFADLHGRLELRNCWAACSSRAHHNITTSQCRTAVPHSFKGDAASQWEMAILGVSELRNPWTDRLKFDTRDYVCELTSYAEFHKKKSAAQGLAGNMVKCTPHVLFYIFMKEISRAPLQKK